MSDTDLQEQEPPLLVPTTTPQQPTPPPPIEPDEPRPETEPPAGKQEPRETWTDNKIEEHDRKARETFASKLEGALDPDADDPAPGSDAARERIRDAIRQGK